MTRQHRHCAMLVAVALLAAAPAHAYLHLTVSIDGQVSRLRWDVSPVRWYASTQNAPGVSATEMQAAVARAFATWAAVETSVVRTEFVGFTAARPFDDDDISVFGFLDEPDMDRVLGATSFLIDATTGDIFEADVFFNAAFPWSTAPTGNQARFDLESVAVHEIGHFLGLGHSALGETELLSSGGRRVLASGAVMFPIAFSPGNIADRRLQPDDVAGLSDLYPTAAFRAGTGAVRGRIRRAGRGVPGAHVVAFNLTTRTLIGGFALDNQGEFQIAGLSPGPHLIRVEPLDDADIESFFDGLDVDTDFRVTFHLRHVVAPDGGVGQRFDVTVRPK